jgi:LysR family cyn operon transcriptional activator
MHVMNLRQVRTFVAIADAGGLARAEGRLHLSQPAASRQVQALEAELGVPLFNRVGRRMRLTTDGEDLLRRSRRLLQEAESLSERARALKGGQAGTLRVGGSTQHIESVLAGFLPHYRRRHPTVDVDLVEDGGARISDHLERGDIHLALMAADIGGYPRRLLAPAYVLALVALTHRLARAAILDITELRDERLLLLRRDFAARGWFDAACQVAHISPRIILESAAPHTLMALAQNDYGIAILPSNVRIPRERVRVMPLVYRRAAIGRWASVAWDSRRFLPPYAGSFVEELVADCRRNYPGREFVKRAPPLPRPKESLHLT